MPPTHSALFANMFIFRSQSKYKFKINETKKWEIAVYENKLHDHYETMKKLTNGYKHNVNLIDNLMICLFFYLFIFICSLSLCFSHIVLNAA